MTAARKFLIATLAAVALFAPAAAQGAQYTVHACGEAARYENHLFVGATSDSRMAARTICATDADGHTMGVGVLAGVSQGPVPVFANATQSFLAPSGTTINRVQLRGEGRTANGDWAALLQSSNDGFGASVRNVAGCAPRPGNTAACTAASANADQTYDIRGSTGFRSIVACGNFAGCGTFVMPPWPFSRAYYLMHRVDITLEDGMLPAATVIGGGLAELDWLRGSQRVVYEAADNSGVSQTEFAIDQLGTVDRAMHPCDYTWAVPCRNVNDASFSLDTTRVDDGRHQIRIAAVDATGVNRTEISRPVLIDNHAPAEPVRPSVEGGEGWHTTDNFSVRWTNPASAAPITRARYEICRPGGSSCVGGEQSGEDISSLSDLHVGAPGDYTVRVWLADAAGNVSNAKSSPLHLKFDNVPPAQAAPQHRNGWLNHTEAREYVQAINKPEGFQLPVSGLAGYATSIDGADPGTTIDVPADPSNNYVGRKSLKALPEGTLTFKARAISGAGVPSTVIGSTQIHVDLTPPIVSPSGAPDPDRWRRTPVGLQLTAVDPGTLSGMAGASNDRSVESGGYISFELDGQHHSIRGRQRDSGPDGLPPHEPQAEASLSIGDDGIHTLNYRAADVAGNIASDGSLTFRIDQTPPELAVFEAQSASDPRLVAVAASDRLSGLADGGRIQLRRIAPDPGEWISSVALRHEGHYYTRIENATLPEGDYEFRAIVPDQAGNEAVATSDRQGRREVLHVSPTQVGPYSTVGLEEQVPRPSGPDAPDARATIPSSLAAWAVQRQTIRPKCKRAPRRRPRKRCPRPTTRETLVHDLRVPFRKTSQIRGVLTTAAGKPIANAEVVVLARPSMAGARYAAEASVRTNRAGGFTYRAAAGPSRILDLHYRGNETYKHSDDQVTLRVPAAATIRVNRRSVRNRRSVVFSGKLQGRPFPAKGKVLDLQAYYRRKWRTFATPRAGINGKWRYRYRFEATRGTVRYKFRLRIRATSDYPYEAAYSRVVSVRVRP